jgi:hypothetical protein
MHATVRCFSLAALLWGAAGALPAKAEETCLKQVFDGYCLGGDYRALLARSPLPVHQQREGDSEAAIYMDGPERLYVMAFRGQIYKLVRQYRPSTQMRYDDLTELLTQKYGPAQDRSRFPQYAESRGARIAAIRRGDGRAERFWNPGQGWSVELSWTRELGLALAYVHDQLDAERHRQLGGRL